MLDHVAVHRLDRYANSVANSPHWRIAMTDDGHPINTEKRRPTVLSVVKNPTHVLKVNVHVRFSHSPAYQLRQVDSHRLVKLQNHVADESVADYDVTIARDYSPTLNIPGEIEPARLQEAEGLDG